MKRSQLNQTRVRFAGVAALLMALSCTAPLSAAADPHERIIAKVDSKAKVPLVAPPGGARTVKKISSHDIIKWSWKLRADRTGDDGGLNQTKFANPDTAVPLGRALAASPGPPPAGAPPAGTVSITGFLGSTSTGTGNGTSVMPAQTVTWNVTATGTLGGPARDGPKWSTEMRGWDPFVIGPVELDDLGLLGEDAVDLFFPVSMFGAEVAGADSGVEWDVWLDLNNTRYDLLSVSASESGASVSGGAAPADFTIDMYAMADVLSDETDVGSVLVTPSELEAALASDFADGVMDGDLTLGFLMSGVPVAEILAGNAVLNASALVFAGEAAVPTPGTLALLGLGGLAACRRRR